MGSRADLSSLEVLLVGTRQQSEAMCAASLEASLEGDWDEDA